MRNKKTILITQDKYRDYYRKGEHVLPRISDESCDHFMIEQVIIEPEDKNIYLPTVKQLRNILNQVHYDDEDKHIYILNPSGKSFNKSWDILIEINDGCIIGIG